jgi:hypothetical protein
LDRAKGVGTITEPLLHVAEAATRSWLPLQVAADPKQKQGSQPTPPPTCPGFVKREAMRPDPSDARISRIAQAGVTGSPVLAADG